MELKLPKSRMPTFIKPALATLVTIPPLGDQWLHEIKFDGYRMLAFVQNKKIRLMSRNNQNWTSHFQNITTALKKLSLTNAIFDGEIVLLDKKQRSNFQLMQNAEPDAPFVYFIFDLLYYDGHDLTALPIIERKKILKKILPKKSPVLRFSDHIIGSGSKVFAKSCKLGLEGIVSKNINSPYLQKRSREWLKIKCQKRQEFVIGGYTPPQGSRQHFGALLVGYYNNNKKLIYAGRVGTGFDDETLNSLFKLLKKNSATLMPFSTKPPASKKVTWVKPVLVGEVEFTEWTSEGILRHPSFKGLRKDKPAKKVFRE